MQTRDIYRQIKFDVQYQYIRFGESILALRVTGISIENSQ